ncbi:MAG: MGMT family protein [Flavobacteriales bacterium]
MENNSFFQQVYQVVRLIPKGRVTSYGAIATYLSAPRSARMVGWAMNASHGDNSIPAHRVVNRKGFLTGKHHFGLNPMEELLKQEGINVIDNQVQDFEKIFWNPVIELL